MCVSWMEYNHHDSYIMIFAYSYIPYVPSCSSLGCIAMVNVYVKITERLW